MRTESKKLSPPATPAWESILVYVVLGPWLPILPLVLVSPGLILAIPFFPLVYAFAGLAPMVTGIVYVLIRRYLARHSYPWQIAMGLIAATLALMILRLDYWPMNRLPPAIFMSKDEDADFIVIASLIASPLCACFIRWGDKRPRIRRCAALIPLALMLWVAVPLGLFLLIAAIAH
ncbi:hypothetical protein ACUY1T_09675 [Billgrantia sp. Q4P2]|uniref:hypothetical protein n=1 Tax=Billgrantia sp. Q4P2 TaxID=3463857 RepID=UPI004055E501